METKIGEIFLRGWSFIAVFLPVPGFYVINDIQLPRYVHSATKRYHPEKTTARKVIHRLSLSRVHLKVCVLILTVYALNILLRETIQLVTSLF